MRNEAHSVLHPHSHYTLINPSNLNYECLWCAGDAYSYPSKTNIIFHATLIVDVAPNTDLTTVRPPCL